MQKAKATFDELGLRAQLILEILEELFPNPTIPLDHRDPYTFLIAVLLSAQSTDKRVNEATPHLFALATTPQEMAALPVEEIEEAIKKVGIFRVKARAIKRLSQILVEKHRGEVPSTFAELEALPGVGHKTASVIMSSCFHKPAFPVDTHIHRCAKRWGLSRGKNVVETEKDLKELFPESYWNKLHLQMIYYARNFCPARGHKIEECPICSALRT